MGSNSSKWISLANMHIQSRSALEIWSGLKVDREGERKDVEGEWAEWKLDEFSWVHCHYVRLGNWQWIRNHLQQHYISSSVEFFMRITITKTTRLNSATETTTEFKFSYIFWAPSKRSACSLGFLEMRIILLMWRMRPWTPKERERESPLCDWGRSRKIRTEIGMKRMWRQREDCEGGREWGKREGKGNYDHFPPVCRVILNCLLMNWMLKFLQLYHELDLKHHFQ